MILAACVDQEGAGGLYAWDSGALTRVDPVNTSSVRAAAGKLFRLFYSEPGGSAGIAAYDANGLLWYHRLDGHGEAHHIGLDGGNLVIASTFANKLVWLSPAGEALGEWPVRGRGDCRHINATCPHNGRLLVCAFGRFDTHRGWEEHARDGSGIVFDLSTDEDVLTGLNAPHHPVLIDGRWLVCDSGLERVVVIDAVTKKPAASVPLGGWTRGVAVLDDCIAVGISAPRHGPPAQRSAIALLCRRTYKELERIPVPAREIGDLCVVDEALYRGCLEGRTAVR